MIAEACWSVGAGLVVRAARGESLPGDLEIAEAEAACGCGGAAEFRLESVAQSLYRGGCGLTT